MSPAVLCVLEALLWRVIHGLLLIYDYNSGCGAGREDQQGTWQDRSRANQRRIRRLDQTARLGAERRAGD